jgi:hypothetical protein
MLTTTMPPMTMATGGTLVSGTYWQEQSLYYQGSTAYSATETHHVTLYLDATNMTATLLTTNNGSPVELSGPYTVTNNNVLSFNFTCPMPQMHVHYYTYSNGTLTLYDYMKNQVDVLQKQ